MILLAETGLFQSDQLKVLKKRGIQSLRDLLFYFPRRYVDAAEVLDLRKTRVGDVVTFIGRVRSSEVRYGRKRRLVVSVAYDSMAVQLVFFQAIPYYSKILSPGVEAAFSGKVDFFQGAVNMLHPEIEVMSGDELIHTGKIIPIYKITEAMRTAHITSRVLRKAIHEAMKLYASRITDPLEPALLQKQGLPGIQNALLEVHFPENFKQVEAAKRRLAFDELLVFSALMYDKRKARMKLKKSCTLHRDQKKSWGQSVLENLPFELTGDQKKAISRIKDLIYEPYPCGVLLQGDVGSGKTLVALLTALEYLEEGRQVAVMAPTEILARQHYANFINYLSSLPFLQMELLTGSEKASEKRAKIDRIKRGDTLFVVGTHALIQEGVDFANLGLVIIDEQHRFGVEQRESLRAKGSSPDLLAMSATPIPRSLTLTLYGDLEAVVISEKPPGRQPVDTRLFPEKDLGRLYKGVQKYVDQGRQAYIVYPVIEESQKTDWASVMADYQILEKEIFSRYRLGILHGKLDAAEKDRAMQKFKEGLIQILVTTTVVEVGVDVPNATVMMIRNAEKFGLSQLHQLRGRVGRGDQQSFCILVKSPNVTPEGEMRLSAMLESDDGFYLAQKDFEIRGSGELLSTRQAGVSEFKVADLRVHAGLAASARDVIESDASLREMIMMQKNWKKALQKGFILFDS